MMTKTKYQNAMKVYENRFYSETCPLLQLTMIQKIVNCRNIDDFTKIALTQQYIKDMLKNKMVVDTINKYNKGIN